MTVFSLRLGWFKRQGVVPVAFKNSDLDIDLYMELTEGYKEENDIILIKKGLTRGL